MTCFRLLLAVACSLGLFVCGAARAAGISNGDFATDLSDWSTLVDQGNVQWINGEAVLSTGAGTAAYSAVLVQGDDGNFTFANPILVTSSASILKFDAVFFDDGEDASEVSAGIIADHLNLVAYDANSPAVFNLFQLVLTSTGGPAFAIDVSSLIGLQVAFSFELGDELDGRNSGVRIDNVQLVSVTPVPIPGALWLLVSGLAATRAAGRRSRT